MDLSLFCEGFAGDLEFGYGFGGAVCVKVEQAEQVVSKRKLRAYLDGPLGIFYAFGGIDAVTDARNFQQSAQMPRIVLQFLLKPCHGFIEFVRVQMKPTKCKMQI